MELTKEQEAIIHSTGNIKINAVAGSGKTTTIVEYAKSRPAGSRILYLAFNKSVKLDAAKKFSDKGLDNVKVETAHSLAYRHIVFKHNYKVRPQGYKTNEIAQILGVKGNSEKHTEFVVANHIQKYVTYFCNSDKLKIQDLNYSDTITDAKAKVFVASFQEYILAKARQFLSMMDAGEIEITHDFYLKKFQLSNPVLPYDYILFDEGQDASAAMLDVFFKQSATKVIVGDTHQQIYSWRFAVNSLEKADFNTYHLSTSFRFGQDVARLAMEVLNFKKAIEHQELVPITGQGRSKDLASKAILARTNLGLLLKAIEYINEHKSVRHIYFEGNINSYTYADDGASLYDVLNLSLGKHHLIRDSLIKGMHDLDELEDYIKKSEDVQLSMMVEIVKEYGIRIPEILKTLKEKHVENADKHKAEMIFSTIHRCKGMEYDSIELVNDFTTMEKMIRQDRDVTSGDLNASKLNEEINLLYVAITRVKNKLLIPETLVPKDFPASAHIEKLKVVSEEDKQLEEAYKAYQASLRFNKQPKIKSYPKPRGNHKESYRPWTRELDEELSRMILTDHVDIDDLATFFGRSKGAIISRINKLQPGDN